MDEAAKVLERLERIDALDRERVPAPLLLGELRELVREAEAWARVEGDGRASAAAGQLIRRLGQGEEAPLDTAIDK